MLMPFPLWKRELWHFQSFYVPLLHETYQKLDSHQGTANSAAAVEEKGSQGDCLAILPADLHAVLPADLHANLQVGSNIYKINNNISSPPEENPSEEGRKFFHEINTNPAEKAEVPRALSLPIFPLRCLGRQRMPGGLLRDVYLYYQRKMIRLVAIR